MTFKRYFTLGVAIPLVVLAIIALIGVYLDEFGLFREARGRRIRIFTEERVSKYLLSFRYIPANFEGLIIGPSLSDQLNPEGLGPRRFYNLSITGGNVSDLRLPLENCLARGRFETLIICLDPYLTKDFGQKDQRMQPRAYWSTLGSTFMLKHWGERLLLGLGLKRDTLAESYNGYVPLVPKRPEPSSPQIERFADLLAKGTGEVSPINSQAYVELEKVITTVRQRGVRIVAFYHPMPSRVMAVCEPSYRRFQERLGKLFQNGDIVWDFNTPEFFWMTGDPANYIDHGHLSPRGAAAVLAEIKRRLPAQMP